MDETLKMFPLVNYNDDDINLSYCLSCDKNCVIDFLGYTQCMSCKDIIVTDLKQIRKTYTTKSKTNKIVHFTNALNEYLKGCGFSEVQQIVDIFEELIDFMRLNKNVGDKLPNINTKFFIEKIIGYLRLGPEPKRSKKFTDKDLLWYHFTQYKFNNK